MRPGFVCSAADCITSRSTIPPGRSRARRATASICDTCHSAMDFRLTDEQELLRRSGARVRRSRDRGRTSWSGTRRSSSRWTCCRSSPTLGLMGIQFPEEYGGAAMSAVDYCICIEELARVCPAIALSVAAHNGLCSAHIAMFGSDEQKQTYLPRLVARRGARRLGPDRGERRQRRRRRCGRRRRGEGDVLGAQRRQELHHPRHASAASWWSWPSPTGRRATAASRPSSSSTARRA